ncbi:MAG: rhodanese-like domain-containing protein [Bacteroidia bacterium]|nr:rhodanese-like domain-containing protein [Bacteroidia bacterium]
MSILSMLFGGNPVNENTTLLSPEEFKENIFNKKVQLVDIRTPREYQSSHIKGAKNINFYSGSFASQFNKLDKNKPVYIYCRTGSRSRHASNKLYDMGFKEIYDLKGGIVRYR